jgi:hypothetical protein
MYSNNIYMYKLYHIDKNSAKSIYIFKGYNHTDDYKEEIDDKKVLNKYLDKEDFMSHDTKVFLINDALYEDDTIDFIKRKICKAMDVKYGFDELYLFGYVENKVTNKDIYNILSQNDTIDITYARLFQYLSNFYNIDLSTIDLGKDVYTFDDIISLNIEEKELVMKVPIGQRFYINNTYPITVNPFDTIVMDEILRKEGDNIVSTQNNALMLDMKPIKNNTIYLCTPDDIFDFINQHNASSIKQDDEPTKVIEFENFLKLYYPFLYNDGITDEKTYISNKGDIIAKTNNMLDDNFESYNNNISLLHNIYNHKKTELEYLENGIRTLSFTIEMSEKINIPLEIIFKLLNTSSQNPFIKYNPGKGREKMYRLYAEQISRDGRKIPFLQKPYILKLRANLARTKSVTVHTIIESKQVNKDSKNDTIINTTFFENGFVQIDYQSSKIESLDNIEKVIMETSVPLIQEISDFLKQKGYNYISFSGFDNTDKINYNEIQHIISLNITKKIKLEKYIGCLSSVINLINTDLKSGIEMRYKRVGYFNEMDAMEAFITRLVNKNMNRKQIIPMLQDNFDMTIKDAETKYLDWLSNIQVEQQLHENKKLRIKSNPGFGITITRVPFKNTIIISVDSITNIKYIPFITMYLDSIIRITQDIQSTTVSKQHINKVCKFKEIVVKNVEDIEGALVENLQQQSGVSISDNVLQFDEPIDDDNGLIGLLAEGDEDIDDLGLDFGEEDEVGSESSEEKSDVGQEKNVKTPASPSMSSKASSIGSELGSELDDGSIEGLVFEGGQDTPVTNSVGTSISHASDLSDLLDFGDAITPESSTKSSKKSTASKTKSPTSVKQKVSEVEDDTLMKDITGMPIKNPNPFFQKMSERDPKLFLKRKTGKFNAYSRTCPMNVRRQPVLLTDKEMEKIDRENPGSYSEKIKYGSSPDNQYWYICPRFWCLKTNTSMTEEDVKAGKCGGSDKIIPHDAKVVPKDAFVYEFTDPKEHIDQDGKYVQHYPGFVKQGTHPDDLCIPCCFKSWDAPVQQKRRDICLKGKSKEDVPKKDTIADDYIKGAEKFPLDQHRWGYLPLSIQKILHTDNSTCFSSTGRGIKPFKYCLLRKGVETNKNQSFIGVLADIYYEYLKLDTQKGDKTKPKSKVTTPTIKNMKQIIADSVTIDEFITYYNGALIEAFSRESISINVSNYKSSDFYKNIMKNTNTDIERRDKTNYMKTIIASYENFIDFIKDPDIEIDHTYLWDIVHKPNTKLFPQGINLIILEIPNDDATNNVEILCPTNNYSSYMFDTKKPSLIVMLKDGYYEPIYIYRDEETNIKIHKLFSLYNNTLMPGLKNMLEVIKRSYSKCQPLNSMPEKYEFNSNIYLEKVIDILKPSGSPKSEVDVVEIINQVIQYNQKVIGITVKVNGVSGYVPIEPSAQVKSLDTIYIDDVEWNGVTQTIDILKTIHRITKRKIPCLPKIKVIEDGLIVGVLTETNQFVMLDAPHEDIGLDDLESVNDYNYLDLDKKFILESGLYDKNREKQIKYIELESNYFNAFRNTVRLLLNKYEHLNVRKEIEGLLTNKAKLYSQKVDSINDILRKLLDEHVEFITISETKLLELENINSCVGNKKCDTQYCLTSDKSCKLLIPRKHLISKHDNEKIYFYRMADELIRYGFIKNYIFNPKSYLVLDKVDYKLQDNEIILLDTILEEGYFDNLEPMKTNKYINSQVSEFIEPQISVPYSNILDLTQDDSDKAKSSATTKRKAQNCVSRIKDSVVGSWKKFFDYKTIEEMYKNNVQCGYELIKTLLKDNSSKHSSITTHELKQVLVEKYEILVEKYGLDKIVKKILLDQGKEKIKTQIMSKAVTLSQAIISEDYYLTNLDMILLAQHYDLPLVIISGTQLHELRGWNIGLTTIRETKKTAQNKKFKKNRKMWIVNKDKDYSYYYFVRQLGIKRNVPQRYSLLRTKESVKKNISDLKRNMSTMINTIYKKRPSFDEYISQYVRGIKKTKQPLLIEDDTKTVTQPQLTQKKIVKKRTPLPSKKITLTQMD